MSSVRSEGVTLRQAALIVGLAYLLNPVSYAEFTIFPKLIVHGNITETVTNISAHHGLYVTALICYLINFIEDVIIAWGLYILLAPVNRALALLAAWFQLIYTAVALAGAFNLATVYRMLTTPEYLKEFGSGPLNAQVDLLLHTFRYDYSLALVIFGIHLVLVGYLIVRSSYIPQMARVHFDRRWTGLDRQLSAAVPLPRRKSRLHLRHVFRGIDLHAMALDKGLEDSRARHSATPGPGPRGQV